MRFDIKLFTWLGNLLVHLLIVIARYPLAIIAVAWFTTGDGKKLVAPFTWLDTLDADLTGDAGWQNILNGKDPMAFWSRVRWLWRNGGNAANYTLLGCDYSKTFAAFRKPDPYPSLKMRTIFLRCDGYWLIRKFIKLPGGWFLELFWGWNLFFDVGCRCKFTATTRLRRDIW